MLHDFSKILIFIAVLALFGCTELNDVMELQNEYASNFSNVYGSTIFLDKGYTPAVTRGIISTEFSALLPEGVYVPIAGSARRNFYQAPCGFAYMKNGHIESRVGGIVQVAEHDDSAYYVWYFPKQNKYYEIEPNGPWVSDVKSGLAHIKNRPWVESGLKIYR
ncbi:hypothetical protein [Desulfoluna butyratoxydans]|nr:hypothetical protein [Desulfoluna butyratoxydans]